jgi:hypothetical protein
MPAVPFPPLEHLIALTDDVGILQHAVLDVPNRTCGYCTDDVGRALIVACDVAARPEHAEAGARLVRTYLSYLHDAQLADGWFHGFMGYDRRWQDHAGTADQVGRAIWGLGYAEAHAPRSSSRRVAALMRAHALPSIDRLAFLRSRAYAALGLVHSLQARPQDVLAVRAGLDTCAATLADAYDATAGPDWAWCEDVMTYDNARLPEALLRAGRALGTARYTRIGLGMLEFYARVTIEDETFIPVGNDGWYRRGGTKPRFAQQPLEAAALVDAALVALDLTGDERWHRLAEIGYAWFLGRNTNGLVLARNGGCCDGLDESGINANMGAESTLAFLSSAIALCKRTAETQPLTR